MVKRWLKKLYRWLHGDVQKANEELLEANMDLLDQRAALNHSLGVLYAQKEGYARQVDAVLKAVVFQNGGRVELSADELAAGEDECFALRCDNADGTLVMTVVRADELPDEEFE